MMAKPRRTALGDVEARMQLVPLETLLAERDALVKQVAPLRARHGTWGVYDDLRKVHLSKVATVIRAQAVAAGERKTEAQIEQEAHADERYVAWVVEATKQKERFYVLENRIQGITDTIMRGQAIARYLAQEVGLAR